MQYLVNKSQAAQSSDEQIYELEWKKSVMTSWKKPAIQLLKLKKDIDILVTALCYRYFMGIIF